MRSASAPAVLIMAKASRPGAVKNRLHPLLGPQGCEALQAELVRHTLETASGGGLHTCPAYAAERAPDSGCAPASASAGARPVVERGADPGRRPTAAVTDVFAHGAGPVLVIGTDVPTLTRDHLASALAEDMGLQTRLRPPLRDLDTAQDAAAFLADPLLPPRIAALLHPSERV
ncbi:DUF2064 domain-containing protein [Streptomyces sp. NPDC002845]